MVQNDGEMMENEQLELSKENEWNDEQNNKNKWQENV